MTPSLDTCAYCPKLCRHVCPVSVATARESATPTAMATVALLHLAGKLDADTARAGTSLCAGCGACERHCHHHVDVPALLGAFRSRLGATSPVSPPPPLRAVDALPAELPRFVTCGEEGAGENGLLACCGARGSFATDQPTAAEAMARAVVARFGGEPFTCASASCANWLSAHGGVVRDPSPSPPGGS